MRVFAILGNACTMSEYNKLKSMLLDMQPKVLKTDEKSQQRDMEEKRALVDTMFKYLDVDQDGRLVSDELEKVGVQLSVVRKKKSHKTDSIHKTQVSQNPEIPN